MADEIFERVPGARTLAANMGAQIGAATGVIARLIERTPGGRVAVAEQVIRDLHKQGPWEQGNRSPVSGDRQVCGNPRSA